MGILIQVILPVFLVIGAGYGASRMGWFSGTAADGLMVFAQKFAVPCLLFSAMSRLDLGQSFDLRLLGSFYSGATTCFVLAIAGARLLFNRPWPDSIAIGFAGLFSNSLLLGIPISERAYGADSLDTNFAIISVHSPYCYFLGITVMELVRNQGGNAVQTTRRVLKAMFSNGLIVGILLGLSVNLGGIALPGVLTEAVDMMVRAALPAALFGLGGILAQYRPEGDMTTVAYISLLSLVVHPVITYAMITAFGLPHEVRQSAVLTAAMAPGVNIYVFASMYGAAKRVAATTVLVATAASILTVWVWLQVLG